jgi:hypothetical protein
LHEDRGPFDTDGYVSACARHEDSDAVRFSAGAASLWLLCGPDGTLRTVYGYPQPIGDTSEPELETLADALAGVAGGLRVALSPLGDGDRLAQLLQDRLPVLSRRDLLVADLERDPVAAFSSTARSKLRRAVRGGASAEVGAVRADFGGRYRASMDALGADPLYRFDDAYFAALPNEDAFQVSVADADGLAAAALFLCRGDHASYHLSARRTTRSLPGAANLAVAEGLKECARRGARACILGGGLTHDPGDPLLRFKASMASRTLTRPTFGARR